MTLSLEQALKLSPVELEIFAFKQQAKTGGYADRALTKKNGLYWPEEEWLIYEGKIVVFLKKNHQAGRISEIKAITTQKKRKGEIVVKQ